MLTARHAHFGKSLCGARFAYAHSTHAPPPFALSFRLFYFVLFFCNLFILHVARGGELASWGSMAWLTTSIGFKGNAPTDMPRPLWGWHGLFGIIGAAAQFVGVDKSVCHTSKRTTGRGGRVQLIVASSEQTAYLSSMFQE